MSINSTENVLWPDDISGRGTLAAPWEVSNEQELLALQEAVLNRKIAPDDCIKLTADITVKSKDWVGLGISTVVSNKTTNSPYVASGNGFAGTLDGDGHIVTIEMTADAPGGGAQKVVGGLVNYLAPTGTVKNLTMCGTLTAVGEMDAVGGVVAYNSGTIANVTNYVVVTAVSSFNVGGVTGFNNGCYSVGGAVNGSAASEADAKDGKPWGRIQNCLNHGSILGYRKVGGITGEDAGIIDDCANESNIEGEYSSKDGVGGIAGRTGNNDQAVESGTIENCANFGAISDTDGAWVGGITGFENSKSEIMIGYNLGTVQAYSYRDNTAGDVDKNKATGEEGKVEDTYGPAWDNGAQGYDGTITTIQNNAASAQELLEQLNADDVAAGQEPSWVGNGPKGFPIPKDCGNVKGDSRVEINPDSFVINVIKNPNVLTYVADKEAFDPYGLVIQAIYQNGRRVTVDQAGMSITPSEELTEDTHTVLVSGQYKYDGDLTRKYSFGFDVTVVASATKDSVVLDPGVSGYWGTLKGAMNQVANGGVIYVAATTPLGSGDYGQGKSNVTIKRYSGDGSVKLFTDVMFTVANETDYETDADEDLNVRKVKSTPLNTIDKVTLENVTLDGTQSGSAAPMIRVYSGDLTLESTTKLQNNTIPASSDTTWSDEDAQRGAGMSIQDGTIRIKGEINNCSTIQGGGLVISGGKVELSGPATRDSESDTTEPAAIHPGVIQGCKAEDGSAAYMSFGELHLLSGSKVTGNAGTSTTGKGTIYVGYSTVEGAGAAQLVLNGGTISGNKVKNPNSAEVHIEGGSFTIQCGTISVSEGSDSSYAIRVGSLVVYQKDGVTVKETIPGTLTIDGSALDIGKIYLESGTHIDVAKPIPNSGITIECEKPEDGLVIVKGTADYLISEKDAALVHYANSDYEVVWDNLGNCLILEEQ